MDDQCCAAEEGAGATEALVNAKKGVCPSCQEAGKAVDSITLKSLLTVSLTELRAVEYRFCPTPDCPTVYYSVDGEQQFAEDEVREEVHQKHPMSDDVLVCYCFGHSPGAIRTELSRTGDSSVVERITAGIKDDQCACEIRNPQGSCCLGNVRAVVQRVSALQHSGARSA